MVGEDQVWHNFCLQLLEISLDLRSTIGKEPIWEIFYLDFLTTGFFQKIPSAIFRFFPPIAGSAEYHPSHIRGSFIQQPENRSAAADFDVVRMRAQAEDVKRPVYLRQSQRQHSIPGATELWFAILFPDLPWGAACRIQLFQLLAVFKSVHARPEAVVLISDELFFRQKAMKWLHHQLFFGLHVLENVL